MSAASASERYGRALARLYALAPRGIALGLEPVRAALAYFGSPHEKIPAVHVAGTNGKGSVSALVEACLRASGVHTGLYTSPHLHRFAERVRVAGAPCDEAHLAVALERVLEAMDRGAVPALSFFEAATVAAWLVFVEAGVEKVVLEVGLGGRLDATNVCAPRLCAITRIARDHEALLGATLAAIASEKVGIAKQGVPLWLGPGLRAVDDASREARGAIERGARERGALVFDAPAPLRCEVRFEGSAPTLRVWLEGAREPYDAPAFGAGYQADNVAHAVALARALGLRDEAVRAGLAAARWPARFEWVRTDDARYCFDVAHNLDGVEALCAALEGLPDELRPRALVFGASKDKPWAAMLERLERVVGPPSERWLLCAAGLERATPPERLVEARGGLSCASVREALDCARVLAGGAPVLVCGSVFVVAEARAQALGLEGDPLVGL